MPNVPIPTLVRDLVRRHAKIWWSCRLDLPPLPVYTAAEQRAGEAHLDTFLKTLAAELERLPRTKGEREATITGIFTAFADFAREGLGRDAAQEETILSGGFIDVAAQFGQAVRRFDSTIGGAEIYQTGWNVFTMNGLQMLLGLPVTLTPAIFAYSLLYPYSDNYLDDPTVGIKTKRAFNGRFGARLVLIEALSTPEDPPHLAPLLEGK